VSDGDPRYYSRKYLIACWVEGFASLVATVLLGKALLSGGDPMPVLWWWLSVSGGVLGLYGAVNVADHSSARKWG